MTTPAGQTSGDEAGGPGGGGAAPGPTRFPFRTWLISFLGWTFDFYDLVLFSFVLIPIGRDLRLSERQEALLLGAALGASGIGGILFGYLSDRYGRKRVMTWTIGLYSLGTALTAFASGPISLLVFRLLTGLGVGGEWAVGHALLAESSPGHMRGRAAAYLQAGEPVGVGLAAIVGLLLTPLIGWRMVFLVSSASALIAFVARRHLPESSLWNTQKHPALGPVEALRVLARQRLIPFMVKGWLLGVLKLGTYWTCYIWLPKFLQNQLQQPIGKSAMWILTAQLGQFLGMMAFGQLSDRFGRRQAFTAYSLLTAAALYPLAFHWQALLPHPVLFWSVMFSVGLGSGCTAGFGALLAELFPTEVRNFAMGTTYNLARGVQFLAPLVVSMFVARYGLSGGLAVPLVLAIGTGTWVWSLPETRQRNLARIA
ncbi:MAG: MFS transporter [Deltaproteobacteria bacterium]|nr:MFS transporter [Deltaproteobacteria bacterium]